MGLFNPKTYDESTGLFPNDERAKIVDATCVRFDYNGKQTPIPAVELLLIGEGMTTPVKQYFGVGKAEDWSPSPDGTTFIATGKRRSIHAQTNFALLGKSLAAAGVPDEILDSESVKALIGIDAHWVRTKIKREGLKDAEGKEKDFEALVVTSIYALIGDDAAPPTDTALVDKANAAILRYVAAAGKKGVKKADLPMLVIQDAELASDPDRNDLMAMMVQDDSFLTAGPWEFTNGVIKGK
jgi:hypothetical protein